MSNKNQNRITVASIVSSRYGSSHPARPASWDKRESGVDIITTECGQTIKLLSDGGQSVPGIGWGIELIEGDGEEGFRWTLYSLPKGAEVVGY